MQIDQELYRNYTELTENFAAFKPAEQLTSIQTELSALRAKTVNPDFWNDPAAAAGINTQIGALEKEQADLQLAQQKLADLEFMYTEIKGGSEDYLADFAAGLAELGELYEKLKLRKYLSGKFDKHDAIFSIFAGQGGTEANDWAEMLMRMYLRYFNSKGWQAEIIDKTSGTEAGISSATIKVSGPYAYGYLKSEHGTHRLVRVSPFNAQGLRQTSFAGVEVIPAVKSNADYELNPNDLEINAVRSGGAGGQNVNKVATSIRLRHIPTGILVTCSSERSQLQNKETALEMLRGKLALLEQEKLLKEVTAASGEKFQASWGSQIRNYVLQPYKLIKDLRTGAETDQVEAVLDGDLDKFVNAAVAWLAVKA